MCCWAREMQRDPYWPLHAAAALGEIASWPVQYLRAAPQGLPRGHRLSGRSRAESCSFSRIFNNNRYWKAAASRILLHFECKWWPILRLSTEPCLICGFSVLYMATHTSPKRAVETPTIPDRLYFKIGDVARICKIEPIIAVPGVAVSAVEAEQERHWSAALSQARCGDRGRDQAAGIWRRLYALRCAPGTGTSAPQRIRGGLSKTSRQGNQPAAPTAKKQDKVAEVIGRARAELREIAEDAGFAGGRGQAVCPAASP